MRERERERTGTIHFRFNFYKLYVSLFSNLAVRPDCWWRDTQSRLFELRAPAFKVMLLPLLRKESIYIRNKADRYHRYLYIKTHVTMRYKWERASLLFPPLPLFIVDPYISPVTACECIRKGPSQNSFLIEQQLFSHRPLISLLPDNLKTLFPVSKYFFFYFLIFFMQISGSISILHYSPSSRFPSTFSWGRWGNKKVFFFSACVCDWIT